MAELSKQALKVENNTSFPNNNNGAITPSELRGFNVDMIDSLVDEQTYQADSASWNVDIAALEAFTASQQPSFAALNSFTASQLTINSGVNTFTQSATGRLNNLEQYTASFTTSVGIYDEGTFINNVNQINFNGNGITASFVSGQASVTVDFSNLNSATQSLQAQLATIGGQSGSWITESETGSFVTSAITASSLITASFNNGTRNLTFTKGDNTTFNVNIPDVSGSAGDFVTTASFNSYTSSTNVRLNNLESTSASLLVETSNLETFSASALVSISNLNTNSASVNTSISALNGFTASQSTASLVTSITELNTFSASALISINNLNSATASYVTETESGSFLITASVAGNVLTFTKGNNTTFNLTVDTGSGGGGGITPAETASFFVSASATGNVITFTQGNGGFLGVTVDTGSLASLNLFTQSADISINALNVFTASQSTASIVTSITNLNSFTQSANVRLNNLESTSASVNTSISNINTTTASLLVETSNLELFSASALTSINSLNAATASFVTESETGSFVVTASFNNGSRDLTFTRANEAIFVVNIPDASSSFANPSIETISGSVLITANSFTSGAANILHLTSSANIANIVLKTNNNTATTIISGSGNIFTNTGNPTAGFRRYLTAGNISTMGALPQISASMQFSPTITNNTFLGTATTTNPLTIRGPISSSAYNISSNYFFGTVNLGSSAANNAERIVAGATISTNLIQSLNIIANRTNLTQPVAIQANQLQGTTTLNMNSSSIDLNNNLWFGLNTITNNSSGSSRVSAAGNAAGLVQNIMLGGNTVTFSGSNDPSDTSDADYNGGIYRSMIIGTNTPFILTGPTGSNSIANTGIIGNGLIVTGSSGNPVTLTDSLRHGSLFAGRFNALGTRNLSSENVFVVGTGTSTSARKTGFLIDSASNTFVEGTLNVSGSSISNAVNITGSIGVSGSISLIGNLTQTTGSVTAFGNVTSTNGVFSSSIDGGLYIDNIGYVGSGSAGGFFIGTTTQDLKIQNWFSSSVDGKNIVIENFSQTGSANIHGKVALRARGTGGAVTIENTTNFRVECPTQITGSLTIQSGSGNDFYIYGHKQFNSAEFWSNTTQSGSAGVSGSLTFSASGSAFGVSLVNNSELTIANAGVYNIQFSAQIETSAGADTGYIWFKKNGTNISDSATKVILANNTAQVMTVNILDAAAANDYYQLAYQFTNGNARILAEAASGNIPAIPSVIATITQVR